MSAIMNAYRQHSQELDNNTLNQNKLSFVGKNTEPETDIRKHRLLGLLYGRLLQCAPLKYTEIIRRLSERFTEVFGERLGEDERR